MVNGYVCAFCSQWIPNGIVHVCAQLAKPSLLNDDDVDRIAKRVIEILDAREARSSE